MRAATLAAIASLGICTWGSSAAADPRLDEARRLLQEADFAGALAALDAAEGGHDLGRADVLRLLETRALAHEGRRETAEADRALLALASLEPRHTFGPEVPPRVRARFEERRATLAGPLRLRAAAERSAGAVAIEASVDGDPTGLVREIRVHARAGEEPWAEGHDRIHVPAADGVAVEWWVEAIGPGGAVLDGAGSPARPRRVAPVSVLAGPRTGGGVSPWVWAGVGAGAVAVAVVVVVVATSGGSVVTRVDGPALE